MLQFIFCGKCKIKRKVILNNDEHFHRILIRELGLSIASVSSRVEVTPSVRANYTTGQMEGSNLESERRLIRLWVENRWPNL